MSDLPEPPALREGETLHWFLRGSRHIVSVPAAALASGYVGFGALAHDFGWPLWATALSTAVMFAIPAQVVLVGTLHAGAGLAAAALVVTLSAVRLLPMVVALMPTIRGDLTRRRTMVLAAHFVAVTAWVEALRLAPSLPRPARMPFFLGLGSGLLGISIAATSAGYLLSGALPLSLAIGLFAITPLYFLMSLHRGARDLGEAAALGFGFCLSPLITTVLPGWELIGAGLIGGTAAYAVWHVRARSKA